MRSLNCLLIQNAHSLLCVRIHSVLKVSSKNVSVLMAKEIYVWQFPLICIWISFLQACHTHTRAHTHTAARRHSHSPGSPHPTVLSSSSRRCHSVTSSTELAASQWCLPMKPEISFNRAHPVTLLCHSGGQTGSAARMTARE